MPYLYTARFLRSAKKCEKDVQDDLFQAIKLFEEGGENNKILKLHKLHGKFKAYHAFSADFSYRIIIKITKDATYYVDVGDHGVYK